MLYENSYRRNAITGATSNPSMPVPDAADEAFIGIANDILCKATELMRHLIPSHQSAIALIIDQDWNFVRKYFSLSDKYKAWAEYDTPAKGYGIHNYILQTRSTIRLTQAELESHPEWKNFGTEQSKHPPMRGWMSTPIIDKEGRNWGLLQLSDRAEGDYTEEDERVFNDFAHLVMLSLESAWQLRNLKKESNS